MASTTDRDGILARRRVAGWVQDWVKKKETQLQRRMTVTELENRLGVGKGTGYRLLHADRLGIDVFLKVRSLLLMSADSLLDDDPPGFKL